MVPSGPARAPTITRSLQIFVLSAALFTMPACDAFKSPGNQAEKITSADQLAEAPPGTPVIRSGGEVVTKQELRDAFTDLFAKPTTEDTYQVAAKDTLNLALSRHFLYLEAKARDLEVDPEIGFRWKILSRFWLGDYYLERESGEFKVDPEVVEAFVPEGAHAYRLSQISTFDLAATQDLRQRVEKGRGTFEEIARQYSSDPSAPKGGQIKDWQIMAMGSIYGDEILGQLSRVEEGQMSEIIPTPMGYTFFRVDEKRPLGEREKETIRKRKASELLNSMVRGFVDQVEIKYPLIIDEKVLEGALAGGDPGTVVGRVGDFDITMKFLRGYALHMMLTVDRPSKDTAAVWSRVLDRLHQGMAMSLEAEAQGMGDDEVVKENLARIRKYSLANTMTLELARDEEPSDDQLYTYYRKEFVPGDAEGIFSLTGYGNLTKEQAQEMEETVGGGATIQEAAARVLSAAVPVSGTYTEAELDPGTVMVLERTPAGAVTPPVKDDLGWALYLVEGKHRGEAPPYDQVADIIKARYMQDQSGDRRSKLIIEKSKSAPPEYLVPRKVIDEVVGQWLDFQKALRGVSPPGGFHQRGGSNEIDMPGGSKPAGHPGGGGGKRPSGHP